MNYKKLLKPLQKSSIRIAYDAIGACSIGSSKIGGKPDLPSDFQWPHYHSKIDSTVAGIYPLGFLAQINCEEVHKYDSDSLLPPKGLLYFFYELDTMKWGFDPQDKGCARVYYHPGEVSELVRTEFPLDLPRENQLPEIPVTFTAKNELPTFDEFSELHNEESQDWDAYEKVKTEMGFDSDLAYDTDQSITKLLGYADVVQNSMLLECEHVTNGIYCGESIEIPKDTLHQHKENCIKWQLLFQLDSIFIEDKEIMMWGDMGRLFYYIKADDLKNVEFDNCWLILQCG